MFLSHNLVSLFQKILGWIQYTILLWQSKRELQQIAFNYSSVIDFQDFMNLYSANRYSFLVIASTVGSDNSLRSRKNSLDHDHWW